MKLIKFFYYNISLGLKHFLKLFFYKMKVIIKEKSLTRETLKSIKTNVIDEYIKIRNEASP